MSWAWYAVPAVFVLCIVGYIIWNQFHNLRPERERKIAASITAHEELILCLIAKATAPVGRTPLLRQLQGLKEPEKVLEAMLTNLIKKSCIKPTDKTRYCSTGRGRRIAAYLIKLKRQRTSR